MTSTSNADTAAVGGPGRLARLGGWSTSNQFVGVLFVLVCLVIVFSINAPV